MQYISIFSTIITFIFTAAVVGRYRLKGGFHLLLWGIGLIFYGLGTFSESVLAFVFNSFALRIWYLTGAMLTAAWLGQGSINLLIRRGGVARTLNVVLALVSVLALVLVLTVPLTQASASYNVRLPVSEQYKEILSRSGPILLMTILMNIYGTIALVGGAIYSAYLFWRKKVMLNRVIGNIFIAAGALLPASAGTFVQAGLVDWLYLSEFLGVILMYLGFIQATAPQPVSPDLPATTPVR
jgi:hypothetical protein